MKIKGKVNSINFVGQPDLSKRINAATGEATEGDVGDRIPTWNYILGSSPGTVYGTGANATLDASKKNATFKIVAIISIIILLVAIVVILATRRKT